MGKTAKKDCGDDSVIVRTEHGVALGVADIDPGELRRILRGGEDWFWANLDRPIKLDHASVILRAETSLSPSARRMALKRFRPRGLWKSILQSFRPSRARRNWRLARALAARRIPTARPLAVWEPRDVWWRRESYLASEWIEGSENMHLYAWRLAKSPIRHRLRRAAACAESLGRLIGRMHASGISNRDLKGANLLIVDTGDRVSTYLVDLDGVRIRRRVSRARQVSDLARLAAGLQAHRWITASVCRRFLRAYLGQFPKSGASWKPLWRAIAAESHRIVRKMRRRGEPIL